VDAIDGIIIGVATAVVATVITQKYFNVSPTSEAQPTTVVTGRSATVRDGGIQVVEPSRVSKYAAPIAQNTPTTEAAYNQAPGVSYHAAFGRHTHQVADPVTLPC
jgi:hypothetical protein